MNKKPNFPVKEFHAKKKNKKYVWSFARYVLILHPK